MKGPLICKALIAWPFFIRHPTLDHQWQVLSWGFQCPVAEDKWWFPEPLWFTRFPQGMGEIHFRSLKTHLLVLGFQPHFFIPRHTEQCTVIVANSLSTWTQRWLSLLLLTGAHSIWTLPHCLSGPGTRAEKDAGSEFQAAVMSHSFLRGARSLWIFWCACPPSQGIQLWRPYEAGTVWGGAGAEERQIGTLDAKLKEVLTLKVMQVSAPCLHDFNSGNLLKFCSHLASDSTT